MRTQESTIAAAVVDAVENRVHQLCRQYAERLQFHGLTQIGDGCRIPLFAAQHITQLMQRLG